MNHAKTEAEGRQVLPYLAELFQQLYLKPEPEGNPLYKSVVLAGEDAPDNDLSHFIMDERDSCVLLDTPAGPVRTVRQSASSLAGSSSRMRCMTSMTVSPWNVATPSRRCPSTPVSCR